MKTDLGDLYLWLANGLRAGLNLPQAFELAAGEMEPPLGTKLKGVLERMERGLSLEESLLLAEKEIRHPDFSMLVYSILLLKQAGGNFVAHFEKLEQILRERARVSEKIGLLTAQGRMQGTFLSLMPPALGAALFFLQPGYLSALWETAGGWTVLALIVLMDLGGWLWMHRWAKIAI